MEINGLTVLISGNYNVFQEGWNGAGVYAASGTIPSSTFKLPIYIGSAEVLRERIVYEHISVLEGGEYNKKTNHLLFNYCLKHGTENIVWFLLESCPLDQTLIIEQKYLDLYRPFVDEFGGFNICKEAHGGMKGRKHSEETKKKISRGNKGQKRSVEVREKMSKSATGKILTEEHKKNIGIASSKRVVSQETRDKISKIHTGKKCSEESRIKQSLLKKGIVNINNCKKLYYFISPDGEKFTVRVLSVFCSEKDLNTKSMRVVASGRRKRHKGWIKDLEKYNES